MGEQRKVGSAPDLDRLIGGGSGEESRVGAEDAFEAVALVRLGNIVVMILLLTNQRAGFSKELETERTNQRAGFGKEEELEM